MRILESLLSRIRRVDSIESRTIYLQEGIGRIEARQTENAKTLREAEFRVFSQWGEDGIIQFLTRHVPVENKTFVEFGVQDYLESNTRFLMVKDNWSGLVVDGSVENVDRIRRSEIYWRHNVRAECAFITRDNINDIIRSAGIGGDIGLLSVDIDGNDYWVWQAIDVVKPRIVVTEYNARFGADRAVSVPYDPQFVRAHAHYSMIYYGASLAALAQLGEAKGYNLVGCNSAGNNAFFVRKDIQPASLPSLSVREAYVRASFRETRDPSGNLSFLSTTEEQKLLETLPLVDLSS
ncbi:hypothetical protein [Methylocystis sp. B8]|uniref:hypothetical protein n=1 Tax=Methylocystis sp. B8 TaxID=544938 RepID=UPI001AEE4B0F|nr:hypothetical protein [Methylocystis sp. B8]